ncbi:MULTISPECIES: hypothetical protein [Serratia]|uniref:Uncharacterized protein n=1 Tax=Serratia fonticola TaxID=47917 RepID=A0AAW3WVR6_SERFO|nr:MULTISPECIES: hypothetical protein [Serratia]MBC3214586.1 hypothetical protein [Serratia fonticola]NYA15213.1 hypothetical protein [Serratia fonticola]NYA35327.1 hypothetical protein [Serratia fonticola]
MNTNVLATGAYGSFCGVKDFTLIRTVARLLRELVCCAAEVLSTVIAVFYTLRHVHTATRKAVVPAQ